MARHPNEAIARERAMTEGGKLFLLFGGGSVLFAAGWWLFHRLFITPSQDPTSSPPLEVDPTWMNQYGGRDPKQQDPGGGGLL
jgi:hypothetical protein